MDIDIRKDIRKLVAAGALAGLLGFGGVTTASAEEADGTTPTTEAPATDDDTVEDGTAEGRPPGREGCDEAEADTAAGPSADASSV